MGVQLVVLKVDPTGRQAWEQRFEQRAGSARRILRKGVLGRGNVQSKGSEAEHTWCSRRPVWLRHSMRESGRAGQSSRHQTIRRHLSPQNAFGFYSE